MWPDSGGTPGAAIGVRNCVPVAPIRNGMRAVPALAAGGRQMHRACGVVVLQGQLSLGIRPRAGAGVRYAVGRDDLGRHAAATLGATWLVRQGLSDEGESSPFGPSLLDSSVR